MLFLYAELYPSLCLISIPLPDRPVTVVYSALWGETDADTNLVSGPAALVAAPQLNLLDW